MQPEYDQGFYQILSGKLFSFQEQADRDAEGRSGEGKVIMSSCSERYNLRPPDLVKTIVVG